MKTGGGQEHRRAVTFFPDASFRIPGTWIPVHSHGQLANPSCRRTMLAGVHGQENLCENVG
jgi:hypothetical protein